MARFIFLSRTASLSGEDRAVARGAAGGEVFNDGCGRLSRWSLITLIKGVDRGFLRPLGLINQDASGRAVFITLAIYNTYTAYISVALSDRFSRINHRLDLDGTQLNTIIGDKSTFLNVTFCILVKQKDDQRQVGGAVSRLST